MNKTLYLIRGPSGTGKSTISRNLLWGLPKSPQDLPAVWIETDQFFTDFEGNYHFNISKIKSAHQWAHLQTERGMIQEVPVVIVANTFIAHWEMERYFELAEEYHYTVKIIRTPGPWDPDILFNRNRHSVPMDVVKRHVNGYQPHPKEQEWTDMSIFKS